MNYIQKLKWQRDKLVEFYYGYCQLDAAHKRFETTSYKGDAQKAVREAYDRLNAAKKDVEDNIIASIKSEEVKNAAG
jgi:hypothetical protein